MKVALLGDIHGDLVFLNRALAVAVANDAEAVIQLGDFGFTYPSEFLSGIVRLTADYEIPLYAIRGNHDDPWWFRQYHRMGFVSFIPDGQTITIGKKRVAFLGGAVSIDRNLREENISWWKDERVNPNVINSWIMNDTKADVLVSHEAPVKPRNLPGFILPQDIQDDSNEDSVLIARAVDQLEVDIVYHGHYHTRETNAYQTTGVAYKNVLVESIASNHEDIQDSLIIREF